MSVVAADISKHIEDIPCTSEDHYLMFLVELSIAQRLRGVVMIEV